VVTEQFYSLILASAIITMLLTPVSMSLAGRFYRRLDWVPPLPHFGHPVPLARIEQNSTIQTDRILLAGYGRIGENMARGLDEAGMEYAVIDIDSERIAAARKLGRVCIHGDASNPVVLATAGINNIRVMAVTFPDPVAVVNAAKTALELNPTIKVVARVHREREARDLRELGEIDLISPEYEASVEFVKRTLTSAGWQQKDINKAILPEKDIKFASDNEHE